MLNGLTVRKAAIAPSADLRGPQDVEAERLYSVVAGNA
jgi:hypothetical protein